MIKKIVGLCVLLNAWCFSYEKTQPEVVRALYQLMKNTHEIFEKHAITYWVFAGTLLGAVRHGGIISWDDDLDIVLYDPEHKDFVRAVPEFEELGYQIVTYPWGYKVVDRKTLAGHPVCIDIPFHERTAWGDYCYPLSCGMDQRRYFFKHDEVFPLKQYQFGDLLVMGPQNPIPYLNRVYPQWQTQAVIYNHGSSERTTLTLTDELLQPAQPFGPLHDMVDGVAGIKRSVADVVIQQAVPEDAPALSNLLGQLGFPQTSDELALSKIEQFAQSRADKLWVAKINDQVVGVLALNIITPFYYPGNFARVDTLVIDAGYRKNGIGHILMQHAEEYALSVGCQRVFLTSGNHRPDAHAFYKRIGYVNNATYFVKYLQPFVH